MNIKNTVPLTLVSALFIAGGLLHPLAASASLESVAESFSDEQLNLSRAKLAYRLPTGYSAEIVASTFEQVIGLDGTITKPLSDQTTQVTFAISKDGQTVQTPPLALTVPARKSRGGGSNPKPAVIPALQEWRGGTGVFVLGENARIVISPKEADIGSPSLRERMEVFAQDLSALAGRPVNVSLQPPEEGDIFVTLSCPDQSIGPEGYVLEASAALKIQATDPQGAFWGTRTLLQVFKQHDRRFPRGSARDYPQYPVRGFMYDVGRKPAELGAVRDVMKTMAYYKLNDLQLHLNDNFIWLHDYTDIPNGKEATAEQKKQAAQEVMDAAPTAFRLESDTVGTNGVRLTAADYAYTKQQFGQLIDDSRVYGVNIVPEIDVPGHAMSFVRVRPDLMYRGWHHKENHDVERTAMLDASSDVFDPATGKTYREETLDFVTSVFDEFLLPQNGQPPVFRDAVVHIGTDEYYGDAEDYRWFADALLKHVKSTGHTPRLWGSLHAKRGTTPVESDGVQMHIWSLGWQHPQPAIDAGYSIINILDADTYVVPNGTGNVGGYGDYLNLEHLYGANWQPHIMRQHRVVPGHPQMLGAQWALWNDNAFRRDTGLTDYDLYERIRKSSAVMAEKTWSTGTDRAFSEFEKLFVELDLSPRANPLHRIESQTDTVLAFDFDTDACSDGSGNGYHPTGRENTALTEGHRGKALQLSGGNSFLALPVESLAPNYTAEFWVKRDDPGTQEQILFASRTSRFKAVQRETGRVGFSRDAWDFSFDYTLPVGQWIHLKLVARGRETQLYADGDLIGNPVRHRFPQSHKYSTFIFPLETIGSSANAFKGAIDDFKLVQQKPRDLSDVLDSSKFRATASSEHGQDPDGDISKILDGNPRTYWHSKYNPIDPPPYTIEVDLRGTYNADCVSFLPRQDNSNGSVKRAELFVKGADDWAKVADFSSAGAGRSLQSIPFPAQRIGAVKLVIHEGTAGFGTLAELYVHRAAPAEAETP